jgi:tetratricopeptide (TPR) repeat protein
VAEQEQPVHRRVALKVIKLGMDTRQVIARFEAERQALALMDHPNIAKVLDAGATETGRPFFVMELVKGVRITDYCDKNNLSTTERLDLFVQVCHAIQHAHQKGIIHRDIKPSNILVTLHDGVPVPKVIDFGIAKATTDQRLTDKTLYTAIEQFIGTPAYMSPEQAELSGLDIDTRSDIYALGVLLYELLTGKTPFDSQRLVVAGLDEIRRIIREEDPPRPSTRLSTLDAGEQTAIAKRRHAELPRLLHLVRGDLDWIAMKCLEKDRNRRYDTANGLALDIERHLGNEPIAARPPSLPYLAKKFLKRRKQLALAGALCCALLVLAPATWLQYHRAQAQRKVASLAALRQEEAQLITRTIARLPTSEAEEARTKECVFRLAKRVRAGKGSQADYDLLARVICLKNRLEGHSIQPFAKPEIRLCIDSGRYNIEGLGAVIVPTVSVENTVVHMSGFPAYLSGWGSETLGSGIGYLVDVKQVLSKPSRVRVSCMLNVYLVKKQKSSTGYDKTVDVRLSDYDTLGLPVAFALPTASCTLVEDLPSSYPAEINDRTKSEQIQKTFAVSKAWIGYDFEGGHTLELEMRMPASESWFPLALRIHFIQINDVPCSLHVADWVIDLNNHASGSTESAGGGRAPNMSWDDRGNGIHAFLTPPEGVSFRPGPELMHGVISVQSSREVAFKEGLEQFLNVPEFTREFRIEVTEAERASMEAMFLARHGNAKAAAAELTKAVELRPEEHMNWYRLAPLLAQSGDLAAYREHRQAMLARFGTPTNALIAERTAKVCLMLPADGPNLATACKLADTAVTVGANEPWVAYYQFQFVKGLAEYRQGSFGTAAEWVQKALGQSGTDYNQAVEAYSVLALALHRLNRAGEAHEALSKATELAGAKLPKLDSGDLGPAWHDWIIAQTLFREAKVLVEGGAKAGDETK